MSKLCYILLSVLLPFFSTSSCGTGTLSCSKVSGSPKPVICDFFNSFVLDKENLRCVKTTIENCLIPALPNSLNPCFLCKNGHTLDKENMKCVQVPSHSVKENCQQYANQSFSCLKCSKDFYVAGGACISLGEAKIDNCEVYNSPTDCQICKPGTYVEEGKCKVFPFIQNCYYHRKIKCKRCVDDHFFNVSANPTFNESSFLFNSFDFSMFYLKNPGYAHWTNDFSSQVCQKGTIKNCKIYETFSTCKECHEGFYRNSSMQCDRYQEAPLPGCFTYTNATTCSKCQFKFILSMGTGTCSPATDVEFCFEYHLTEDRCIRCDSKYYLSQSGTCSNDRVDSLSINNCVETSPNKDECQTCKENYSLSSKNKFCFQDIINCENQLKSNEIDQFHTCTSCKAGFHPSEDKSKCVESKILRCVELVPQKNECQKCEEGYYFDSQKVLCVNQFVENCESYTPMTNTCIKCKNLFFLVNGSCTPIMLSDFCFESDGINNICSKCKPQYIKNGNACDTSTLRSLDVIDPNCQSNIETTKTSNCTDCGLTHFVLSGTMRAFTPEILTSQYCAKINPENGQCLQCVENSSGDGIKCLPPQTDLTTECMQLKEGSFTALGSGNCAKCRDPSTKYLNTLNNSCSMRTNPTINENCQDFPEDDGDCLTCKPGFFPLWESEIRDRCFAMADIPGYKSIPGCTIYNAKNNTCFVCDSGKKLNNTKTVCETYAYSIPLNFDRNMNIISPEIGSSNTENFKLINNCKTYHQVDIEMIKCSQCNTGFVNIVNVVATEEKPFLYDFNSLGINVGLGGFSLPVEKCEPFANSYTKESGGLSITTDYCDVGIQFEEKPGYACIRCKIGRNGTIENLNRDKDGTPLGKTIKGVTSCHADSTMTNTFPGVGYHLRYIKNYVPYVIYMRYSDCKDTSKSIVFNSVVNMDGSIQLERFQTLSGVSNIMYCADMRAGNSFYQNNPNCQIFGFSSIPPPTYNAVNPPVNLCLACKPGFKAVVTPGTGRIQNCEPIVACTNPQLSKYLNGCSTPTYGYKLDTIENNQLILFDDLLQAPSVHSQCLVHSNDLTKCVVCNLNYSLILGSCVNTASAVEYNCSQAGYGLNALNLDYSLNTNQRLMNYSYFLVNKFNIESFRKTICKTCNSGFLVAINPDMNRLRCYAITGAEEDKKILNCLKYRLGSPVICEECESAYIPNIFNGTCVPKSNYANCKTVTGFSQIKCASCVEGFTVNEEGQCVPTNCKRILDGKCTLCNDGFKFKEANEVYCERNMDSLDTCLAYSPTLKTCGKCKNSGVLYHYYELEGAENLFKGFSCEPGLLIPSSLSGWRDYNLDEVYIKVDFNPSIQSVMSSLEYIENDGLKNRLFSNTDIEVNPATTHCFTNRLVDNCIPEFLHGGVYCSKCQNGFIIDKTNNKCKEGSIPNCGIYASETECEVCMPTHFRFNATFCSPYANNMNCLKAKIDKNECETCPENYFMNQTKHCEMRRTDLNCKDFETYENKCTSCVEGFIFDNSSRTCLKRIAKFCEEIETSQDRCKTCKQTYWMDLNNNNLCRASTPVEHCREYEPQRNACKVCNDDFYVIEEGKKCKEKPDGVFACEKYSDFGKCSGCIEEHFLTNNQCIKVTNQVENCKHYQADGLCLKCSQSYFLNQSTNVCEETTISNCLEFSSATTCKKCEENYVLVWNQLELSCESSNISDCVVSVGGSTPICIKCAEGKVLSADKTKCETAPVSILNCDEFYSTVLCKRCKTGFILSKDWKSCIKKPLTVSTVVTNCMSEVESRDIICDMCKPGFKKNDKGICTKCGGDGCLICGSGFNSCNLCQGSYFMNSELKCVSILPSSASDYY